MKNDPAMKAANELVRNKWVTKGSLAHGAREAANIIRQAYQPTIDKAVELAAATVVRIESKYNYYALAHLDTHVHSDDAMQLRMARDLLKLVGKGE